MYPTQYNEETNSIARGEISVLWDYKERRTYTKRKSSIFYNE